METTADSAKAMRTKRLLANKLAELMKKKSLRKISIKELCQSTQLSRAAFYLYFEDKYQLLRFQIFLIFTITCYYPEVYP